MNIDNLLQQAGATAGVDPNQLKQQVESGKLDQLMANMNPAQANMLRNALNNPQLAQQLLNTPQAKNLIQQFMKK